MGHLWAILVAIWPSWVAKGRELEEATVSTQVVRDGVYPVQAGTGWTSTGPSEGQLAGSQKLPMWRPCSWVPALAGTKGCRGRELTLGPLQWPDLHYNRRLYRGGVWGGTPHEHMCREAVLASRELSRSPPSLAIDRLDGRSARPSPVRAGELKEGMGGLARPSPTRCGRMASRPL